MKPPDQVLGSEPPRAVDPSGRDVFEILVREHARMLLAYLRSLLRNADAVDDLFQETMLTAWRRLGDYDRERPFAPWLRGIALRLVLRHRTRLGRAAPLYDPATLAALEERFAVTASPEEFSALGERLHRCLQHLPEALRAAVRLVYEQGLRLRQVGEALDASEEAVKKRVQRARQQLADCLRRAGVAT